MRGIVLAQHDSVVIDARRTFRCAHTYVALNVDGVQLFVCATCDYRTALLPLPKKSSGSKPAALVNINRVPATLARVRRSHSAGRI